MSLSKYKRIVLPCPTALSGGPEAIHQLAYALQSLRLECYVAYFGASHQLVRSTETLRCEPAAEPTMMERYARYYPRVAPQIPLDEDTVVIFPEALVGLAPSWRGPIGVWWLSVDNAMRGEPRMNEAAFREQVFARQDLIHLYQSAYAREFLRSHGATRLYDLGDYTSEIFTLGPPPALSASPTCAYNAAKGSDLAQTFFAENPRFAGLPLKGYTKAQLRDIFQERMFYVDFGHFPGKDRLAREAAASGSIVFVQRTGAGGFYEDFPLPDLFKFSADDVASGELARRLDAVAAAPAEFWAQQAGFRDVVASEKNTFHAQVARHWGKPRLG
jgi:hypothetical protein